MNLNNYCHLSVFCPSAQWYELVFNGVKPFFNALKEKGQALEYLIYCGDKRGEHLLIVVDADNMSWKNFLEEADAYFKRYLLTLPSVKVPASRPVNDFYIDFPDNSIQYLFLKDTNIYTEFVNPTPPLSKIIFEHLAKTSQLIMSDIAPIDQEFFTESRMLLAIQLHQFMLKSNGITLYEAKNIFDDLLAGIFSQSHFEGAYEQALFLLDKDFKEYEKDLVDFFDGVWNGSTQVVDMESWTHKWMDLCVNTHREVERFYSTESGDTKQQVATFYKFIFTETNLLLGIEREIHVYYFITRILSSIITNSTIQIDT
jgi:hypothetical protein